MINVLKKVFKVGIIIFAILVVAISCCLGYYYIKISSKYDNITFDKDKLITATSYAEILDSENQVVSNASIDGRKTIAFDEIPEHTINAFIAIEDQNFYKHNGINYKRILKSIFVNLKSGYAKEGASTISQQLIKNTHLNNEKTLERKHEEFFLTKKLEKSFTKNEIMEAYLNVIYFGNSCFGIENASNFYFDKSASELDIAESAMLAGIIKSPKLYSPILHENDCKARRNLVLNQMAKCNYITSEQEKTESQKDIILSKKTINNCLERNVLNFSAKTLNLAEKDLINSKLKIKTYIKPSLQNFIDNLDLSIFNYDNNIPEYAIIIENNKNGGIEAIRTSEAVNLEDMLRQPASCLKPFLVYAPNFEDGKINLLTKVDDEKTTIADFSPKNAGNKYKGNISVKEAISTSSNVCATKLLNYYGINKAKKTAEKFGFKFTKNDNHLALALGSLYNGCDLLTLTNAYATLANGGKKPNISVVESINGLNDIPLYKNESNKQTVISNETAFLLTKALQDCTKNGTAKKLKEYANVVASKTGTNGAINSNKNTDAYCISYSKDYTVCVWMGIKNNDAELLPQNYNGGNQPASISKKIWDYLKPTQKFEIPSGIVKLRIDKENYDNNNTVKLATKETLDRYVIEEYFNKKYAPTLYADTFTAVSKPIFECKVSEKNVILNIETNKHTSYELHRISNGKDELLDTIKSQKNQYIYEDENLSPNFYEYYIIAEKGESKKSDIIKVLVE